MPSVESTEKTYLKRINTLNQSYAIPLRQFSKSSSTRIIDKYEVTLMFGKIEYIVKANQSLLPVLETCLKSLIKGQNDWLDWLCEQLEKIQKPYCDYLPGYDLIKDTEQRLLKKSKGFRQFCERTKEAMYNDRMGRVGLRELLMERAQRVTCYILIFNQMLKKMSLGNPARANLLSCISTCNWIAVCELDPHLIKAATMCVSFQR
ncbi:Dbl homology domain-containing protein [Phakopsora pachyrhizi]|nr:Dbl homology domain-containing protein [Phakopsora pachyrhizi]